MRGHALALVAFVALGCGRGADVATTPLRLGAADPLTLEGFAACAGDQPDALSIDPSEPLVVIVHGCYSSGSEFARLAEVFELHGQQTVCFNYDHRRTLRGAGVRFRRGLDHLRARSPDRPLTVLAHSQGGLIARIALSTGEPPPEAAAPVRLVTVSSPFSGIHAARHCGWTWLHVLSLGLTTAVCQAVAGANWVEIHPRSDYWQEPDPLHDAVTEHLQIVTDEADTCRRYEDGECVEDDTVFSTDEQENALMTDDERVHVTVVEAGHAQIVGGGGTEPLTLVELLQEHGVLAPTPDERRGELLALLRRLYAL